MLHNYSSESLNDLDYDFTSEGQDKDISSMEIERSSSASPSEDASDKMYVLESPSIKESYIYNESY